MKKEKMLIKKSAINQIIVSGLLFFGVVLASQQIETSSNTFEYIPIVMQQQRLSKANNGKFTIQEWYLSPQDGYLLVAVPNKENNNYEIKKKKFKGCQCFIETDQAKKIKFHNEKVNQSDKKKFEEVVFCADTIGADPQLQKKFDTLVAETRGKLAAKSPNTEILNEKVALKPPLYSDQQENEAYWTLVTQKKQFVFLLNNNSDFTFYDEHNQTISCYLNNSKYNEKDNKASSLILNSNDLNSFSEYSVPKDEKQREIKQMKLLGKKKSFIPIPVKTPMILTGIGILGVSCIYALLSI